jgi:hypothetical protein
LAARLFLRVTMEANTIFPASKHLLKHAHTRSMHYGCRVARALVTLNSLIRWLIQ